MINKNYDAVADCFDDLRSQDIGVNEISEIIDMNFRNPKVLDLGCGTGLPIGRQVYNISDKLIGIDSSKGMLARFSENIPGAEFHHLNMIDIDKIDGEFDLIYGWGSVCHLNYIDQVSLFNKINKKLNYEGIFAFTSGEHEEQCAGSVGELKLTHYSMGKSGYQLIARKNGLDFISANYCSGNFYLYTFRKSTQQGNSPVLETNAVSVL